MKGISQTRLGANLFHPLQQWLKATEIHTPKASHSLGKSVEGKYRNRPQKAPMSISIRTLARTAAAGALAAGAVFGLGGTSAQANTGAHATLGVVPEGNGYYWIPVSGVFPMSRAAAQDAINHGYTVQLRLWGDDPYSDDLKFTYPTDMVMSAQDDGLHFSRSARVPRGVVNEDDSWTDNYDELYVGARAVGPSGNIVLKVESNRVSGYF